MQYLEDTVRLTPVLGGATPERRETRPEKVFLHRGMTARWGARDGARVTRCAHYDYIILPHLLRDSHLLFTLAPRLQSSYVLSLRSIVARERLLPLHRKRGIRLIIHQAFNE
jgi:hypothetical protein